VGIGLLRRRPDFSNRERMILNLARPHWFQGYRTAKAVERLLSELHPGTTAEVNVAATILLGRDGHVRIATEQAEKWVMKYFGASQRRALPDELVRWVVRQRTLTSGADRNLEPSTPHVVERNGTRLIIHFFRAEHEAVLLLGEEEVPVTKGPLREAGLTKREMEVLRLVAQGLTNAAIGVVLETRPRTIAKHLEHIFQKLRVETRTAAAAQAHSVAAGRRPRTYG
jgi:DNA-binding CsgD family transcriptional regulator